MLEVVPHISKSCPPPSCLCGLYTSQLSSIPVIFNHTFEKVYSIYTTPFWNLHTTNLGNIRHHRDSPCTGPHRDDSIRNSNGCIQSTASGPNQSYTAHQKPMTYFSAFKAIIQNIDPFDCQFSTAPFPMINATHSILQTVNALNYPSHHNHHRVINRRRNELQHTTRSGPPPQPTKSSLISAF